jgi:hypothetical protein
MAAFTREARHTILNILLTIDLSWQRFLRKNSQRRATAATAEMGGVEHAGSGPPRRRLADAGRAATVLDLFSSHSVITPMDVGLAIVASLAALVAWGLNRRAGRTVGAMAYVVVWVRYFFGVHMLISGGTYFVHPQAQMVMAHPLAGPFQHYMDAMGLFAVVKAIEVAVSLCLIFDLFTPIALVMEMPISFNIFYLSVFVVADPRTLWTGPREVIFNLFLLAAYAGYFLPMLRPRVPQQPLWGPRERA